MEESSKEQQLSLKEQLSRFTKEHFTEVRRAYGFIVSGIAAAKLASGEPRSALFIAGLGAIVNADIIYQSVVKKFEIDLTGKHFLAEIPLLVRFTPGWKRREAFLIAERRRLAETVVENVCRRTKKYGVKPFRFSPKHLKVVEDEGPKTAATTDMFTGKATLETKDLQSINFFVQALGHECYHTVSVRRWAIRLSRDRRSLSFEGIKRDIDWLKEGIVEKSARITTRELGYYPSTGIYREKVNLIDEMCYQMALSAGESDFFSLFEEALYGRGNLKPLFQTIQEHYRGVGGVKKFFRLVEKAGKLERQLKELEPGKEECRRLRGEYDYTLKELGRFVSYPGRALFSTALRSNS